MTMKNLFTLITFSTILLLSCSKDNEPRIQEPSSSNGPQLIFKFHFDSTLARLDNFGNPSTIPVGNSAQTPQFKLIGAHSIEFAPDSLTQLGMGLMLFESPITSAGGSPATRFDQVPVVADGEQFYKMPLANVAPGSYKWARIALTYQNFDINYLSAGNIYTGSLASFVDDETYISSYTINTQSLIINANKPQGYWGFETVVLGVPYIFEGQAAGTTVPNPISTTSPIPSNSCVITGRFPTDFTIIGNEQADITVTFNISINNSFEWKDLNTDGLYEPSDGVNPGDTVVDMGLRGLYPTFQ
jgi:hypothetical protein